jgi:hypothetical protein
MSAGRFLHQFVTAPSLVLVVLQSVLVGLLRSVNADILFILCSFAALSVVTAIYFLMLVFAWRSAKRGGKALPSKRLAAAMFIGILALWGAGVGGVLLLVDRPPYVSARDEAKLCLRDLITATVESKRAKTESEKQEAKSEVHYRYQDTHRALNEVRRTASRYRLAELVCFIGLVASLVSAFLVPSACYREISAARAVTT